MKKFQRRKVEFLEKYREYNQNYRKEYNTREETYEICNCTIKTRRRSKHNKTEQHINSLNQLIKIKEDLLENQTMLNDGYTC